MSKVNKFRMWDKRLKKMAFTGYHVVGEVTAFGGMEHYIEETRHLTPDCKSSMERWNDFVEMQWTGLIDVANNDIYDGDIVLEDGIRKEVMWFPEGAQYIAQYTDNSGEWDIMCSRETGGFYEIIGNIYSNPELL